MSKTPIPLAIRDLSPFARAMMRQLKDAESVPSHLSLMNMLARSAGFRNFQHLRAAQSAQSRLEEPAIAEMLDYKLVERALRGFDKDGCWTRWPSRRAVQDLGLWVMWSTLPRDVTLTEKEVNATLMEEHHFADPASLRRGLFGLGLVTRNLDGSDYRRVERQPPPEARDLIRRVRARRSGTSD